MLAFRVIAEFLRIFCYKCNFRLALLGLFDTIILETQHKKHNFFDFTYHKFLNFRSI